MANQFFVEVVRDRDEVVVRSIPCQTLRRANKVEDGLNRNLNHDEYYTRVVCKDGAGERNHS